MPPPIGESVARSRASSTERGEEESWGEEPDDKLLPRDGLVAESRIPETGLPTAVGNAGIPAKSTGGDNPFAPETPLPSR